MVMGPTHAMSGAAGGLALAQVLPLSSGAITPPELLIYAGITAGAALLPDLDSPQSTIARSFGPASLGLSRLVEHASQALVNKTRGPRDSTCYNGHRTATHTIWFGILTGLLATLLISIFHDYATITLLCIPHAELRIVQGGHSAFEPPISTALVQATDEWAARHAAVQGYSEQALAAVASSDWGHQVVGICRQ